MPSANEVLDWLVKRISALTRTATDADLTDSDYMAVDNASAFTRKITVASFAAWVLGKIKGLATTKYKGFVALDDADGTGKMDVDTIFNNFAGKFVDNVTEAKADKFYMHNGSLYKAKEDYTGVWDDSKFKSVSLESIYLSQKSDIDELFLDIISVSDKKYTPAEITLSQGKFLSGTGAIIDYYDTRYVISNYIDVSGYTKVKVKCSTTFTNAACAFYNEDYSVNSVAIKNPAGTGNVWVAYNDVVVDVPPGAKYMLLGGSDYSGAALPAASYDVGVILKIEKDVEETTEAVGDIAEKSYTPQSVDTIQKKFISYTGVITDYNDAGYYITDYIDVSEYKKVKVSCSATFTNAQCVFYNEDYSVNSVAIKNPSTNGNTWVKSEDVVVEVPAGAKYMLLAGGSYSSAVMPSYQSYSGYMLKIQPDFEALENRVDGLEDEVEKVENDLGDITDKVYTPFPITPIQGKLIKDSGVILDYESDWYYVTDYIDVSGKAKVYVDCACTWTNAACAFYNEDYSVNSVPIRNTTSSGNDWNTRLNVEVVVPDGAKYMVLSGTPTGGSTMPKARYEDGVSLKKIWAGKKWCCVGDSLTGRNIRTTKNYADYISEETGITIVNMGVSGTGYKRQYENDKAFYQRISSVPTDADVVTIFGSGNDQSYFGVDDMGTATDTGTTTLGGCINTTIDNLYARLPAVHLGIVAPCPWGGYNPANHTNGMARYTELLKEICFNRSIPFLDLYHESNLRPWDSDFLPIAYSKDNGNSVHPDETGHKLLAGRFKVFVESIM